jgi:RNA polymerase sigma-70 factor (ECF subfamily)
VSVLREGGGLSRFEGDQKAFVGWLMTIARRRLVDHQRRWWRRPREVSSSDGLDRVAVTGDGTDPAEVVGDRVTTEEALQLLAEELTPRQLEAVMLHVVGGLKLVEVAHRMGSSPNAVAVLYHRALKRLAKRLSQRGATDDS